MKEVAEQDPIKRIQARIHNCKTEIEQKRLMTELAIMSERKRLLIRKK